MKLELLAGLLGKTAEDLRGSLNLANDLQEVEDEMAVNKVREFINLEKLNAKQNGISEGKKQSDGRFVREKMEEVEKKLKDIGIEGANFDEQINFIAANKKADTSEVNKDLQKKYEILRVKFEEAEKEKNNLVDKFHKIGLEKGLQKKLSGMIDKFQFATEHVKTKAIEDFINSNKFLENDGEVFLLDNEGKPTAKFDEVAQSHFGQWGELKQAGQGAPPARVGQNMGSFGNTPEELYSSLRKATTPEETASILEKIGKLK